MASAPAPLAQHPPRDPLAPASIVAAKFGGTNALARSYDPPRSTGTIDKWIVKGLIPQEEWPTIKANGLRCTPKVIVRDSDFIDKRPPAGE